MSFKPLAGITCIATRFMESEHRLASVDEFQTPRGNYLHCNSRRRTWQVICCTWVSNPSRELPALQR